jgi:DNA polymerase-4
MRAILHVDMDAFYASVEQHDRPELRGKPLIVGGGTDRGVVAAASYEVRRFGVRSAMPTRLALARCPDAIVVAPRMARYREVSAVVFSVFHEMTPMVEGLSLDEAFLDITASQSLLGTPREIAEAIKMRILGRTGLTASVGIATNKLLAKIASDLDKPNGLHEITAQSLTATLDPLPASRLPGIGPKTAARLEAVGIHTFADLRTAPDTILLPLFGRYAARMRDRAAGRDDRPVVPEVAEQQVSAEETFDTDLVGRDRLRAEVARLADRVGQRLRGKSLEGSTVTLKVRRSDFSTVTRSRSFEPPTADTGTLLGIGHELLDRWLGEHPLAAVRLLGVGVGGLVPTGQLDLFAAPEATSGSLGATVDPTRVGAKLDPTLDQIRARFGDTAVRRASSLDRPDKNDGFTGVRRR